MCHILSGYSYYLFRVSFIHRVQMTNIYMLTSIYMQTYYYNTPETGGADGGIWTVLIRGNRIWKNMRDEKKVAARYVIWWRLGVMMMGVRILCGT